MTERTEALLRILIGIISGLILGIWKVVVQVVVILHWFYTIITGKRSKALADFSNMWITYVYNFLRYMTFATNKRPFPFNDFGKDIEKVDMKK
ncbi:hypothetical protein CL615_00225 [archaeon]|jgi:hypothetical protein|nr:hypothetical protein [archaeon]MDP6547412.1 DUF4389 domain-containing protein [Candidatus Woesearchaeota archaeon]|tara:strand:+ start:12503 stop:12781 length:279 start_codon:yes stop_codon:yes gene_type:complete